MDTTNTTKTVGEYKVHEGRVEWLLEKISKLNKKAAKLGVPGISIEWTGEKLVSILDSNDKPTGEVIRFLLATITGVAPKLAGWTFVATLNHAEEAGTVIRTIPGFDSQVPIEYRTATTKCDHCKTLRTRRDTYLLRNDAGEWKQVGSNCLADFLGGLDPHAVAQWAAWCFEVDETAQGGQYGTGDTRIYLASWLAHVAAAIRVEGRWTSKKAVQAYGESLPLGVVNPLRSSADIASSRLFAKGAEELRATTDYEPQPEDYEFAEAALSWVKETFHTKDPEARSDFEHNLVVATGAEAITRRSLGIAAAAVGLYKRHLDGEVERKARDSAGKNSDYLAPVGERKVFWAKPLSPVKPIDGQFGTTYLYKLITREGSVVTWFGSHRIDEIDDAQDFVALIGTVKKQEVFRDQKQTVVSRVAVATQKQIDKATGDDKKKKAQAKEAARVERRLEQLSNEDW